MRVQTLKRLPKDDSHSRLTFCSNSDNGSQHDPSDGNDIQNDEPISLTVDSIPKATDTDEDPFDPRNLRLSEDSEVGVRRQILVVRCGKPNKQEFVRVLGDETYRVDTAILIDQLNRETYLVARTLWSAIPEFITRVRLCTAITRHGSLFLWPATLPSADGRGNDWHESMLQAQDFATKKWARVQADMSAGSYVVFEAMGNLPDPEWPDLSFQEILTLAFKDRFIHSLDHPMMRQLNGEA